MNRTEFIYQGNQIKTLFNLILKFTDSDWELTKTGDNELTLSLDPLSLHSELEGDPNPYYPESIYHHLSKLEEWLAGELVGMDINKPGVKKTELSIAFRIRQAVEDDIKTAIKNHYVTSSTGRLVIAGNISEEKLVEGIKELNLPGPFTVLCPGDFKPTGGFEKALEKLGGYYYDLSDKSHELVTIDGHVIYPILGVGDGIKKQYGDLPRKVDLILTNESPLPVFPVPTIEEEGDYNYDTVLESRKYLEYVLGSVKTKTWIYTRYNKTYTSFISGVNCKSLGDNEITVL